MSKECLFCDEEFYTEDNFVCENKLWKVIYDSYPVSNGHMLIIPKRHFESVFDMNIHECMSLYGIFRKAKRIMDERFKPDGYNIGVNVGEYGGQTIMHLHFHFMPRYKDDGGKPCGVRNVFPPNLADYRKYF